MQTGDAYSSGHLVPFHLGLAYVLLVENNPFPELVVIFFGLCISNIPRYFLDFALLLRFNALYIEVLLYDLRVTLHKKGSTQHN